MNLPHLDPLLYAKKMIMKYHNTATVFCVFPNAPTLSMFIEAAAQSSSVFDESVKLKSGFLTTVKNIKLVGDITELDYIIKLTRVVEVNNMKQFDFEASGKISEQIIATGNFTVLIEE